MDISVNIPDWLKIPLKILLPALWIFSGIMILLPDEWLQKLYLLEWAQKNGFVFGLVFIIVTCLLLVYLFYYSEKKASSLYHKLTFRRKALKRINSLSDVQQAIIYKLYNSPGFTAQLDYNHPVVQGLLGAKFIFMGGLQQVTVYRFSNNIPLLFTLQPFVYQSLDHYRPKVEKKIEKLERKGERKKSPSKRARLAEQLRKAKEYYDVVYNGGLD